MHTAVPGHTMTDAAEAAGARGIERAGADVSEQDEQFPAQQQQPPGLTEPMTPTPDHGESSYEGHGLLTGRRALITGGDSGIGRAVAIVAGSGRRR